MNNNNGSFKIGIEFESVLKAISKQIYETPHAFIRENVQNAIDAVRIQALRDGLEPANPDYQIEVTVDGDTVSVRDNGIGMSRDNLRDYFWTIGSSGKRGDEAQAAGCVGMFGIGGFANFGVCGTLQVISQDSSSSIGTSTALSAEDIREAGVAIPSVTVAESADAAPRGTVVIGQLFATPRVDQLKDYLKSFVRYVPILIEFNGEKISQETFEQLDDQDNLTAIGNGIVEWQSNDIALVGQMWEDRGNTLVVAISEMIRRGQRIAMGGRLRFEGGAIDVLQARI